MKRPPRFLKIHPAASPETVGSSVDTADNSVPRRELLPRGLWLGMFVAQLRCGSFLQQLRNLRLLLRLWRRLRLTWWQPTERLWASQQIGLGDCCLGEPWTLMQALHGDCEPLVNVGGWLSFGYHDDSNGLFNDRPDQLALHQAWVYAEKAAVECESPLGFRVDLMYGLDANDTQAFGNNPGRWDFQNGWDYGSYGWALPQLYGELAIGGWNIKAGHFFTLVGYEVVTAPDNFFYSHAMTMYNSEPFTHTGAVASRSTSGRCADGIRWMDSGLGHRVRSVQPTEAALG